jgi:hypothetical protein
VLSVKSVVFDGRVEKHIRVLVSCSMLIVVYTINCTEKRADNFFLLIDDRQEVVS